MNDRPNCADCGGAMEIGFIPDASYASFLQTHWHAGTPEDKRFLGLRLTGVLGRDVPTIKNDPAQLLPISAYRCTDFGALKFFARKADGR